MRARVSVHQYHQSDSHHSDASGMSLASSLPDKPYSESSFLTDYESAPRNASQYHRTGSLRPASRYSQAVEAYRPQSPPSPPLHAQRFSLPPRPGLQQTRTSDWLENVRRSPRPPSPGRRAFISAEAGSLVLRARGGQTLDAYTQNPLRGAQTLLQWMITGNGPM